MKSKRKRVRIKQYDYSQSGWYFVTICTYQRRPVLSSVVGRGLAPAEIRLTPIGLEAEKQLLALEERYPHVRIDKYAIMPDHIHAIIVITSQAAGASPRPTLMDIVCTCKSLTTRQCRSIKLLNAPLFQTSFYEHVIRNEQDYQETWQYIDNNPTKWMLDHSMQ